MKFTIEREAFLSALTTVTSVVERVNTIPILGNVLIRSNDAHTLTIHATDLSIAVSCVASAEIATTGALTTPSAVLFDIIKKLPAQATITIEIADRDVLLKSGRSRFKLKTLPDQDFPEIVATEMQHSFEFPGEQFRSMLAKTTFAISTEEARYYLNGILMHERGDELRACATDGHRLSLYRMPLPHGARGIPDIIVPLKTIKLLPKLAEKAETIGVSMSSTKIRFEIGSTTVISKLIDGTFPDYERVIPRGNDRLALMDHEELSCAVGRVSAVSSQRGRGIKFSFSESGLTLSVNDPDVGSSSETVDASFNSPALDIGFNAAYVRDCLDALDGENVEFLLAEPGSPTIMRTPGKDNHTLVIMPTRV